MGPNNPFSTRYIFWENWLFLLCTCCVLSYYNLSKKFSETKLPKRFHDFVPNLAWVDFSIKNNFIGKVDQYFIGLLYSVMLHNLKKSSESRSESCTIFAKISACHKRKFSWKIDWCLIIALHYALLCLSLAQLIQVNTIGPILLQRGIFVHHAKNFNKILRVMEYKVR